LAAQNGIPDIFLARAQALWVLSRFGFRTGGSHSTLLEYVKLLRRLGIPFSHEERIGGGHHRNIYRYEHLMELAVALSFRLHRILPWDVVNVLVEHRAQLRSIYRRAYLERESGTGRPMQIKVGDHQEFYVKGIFLDLNFCYVDDQLVSQGGPRVLNPAEAIQAFIEQNPKAQIRPPFPLSPLASQIVELAAKAPAVRGILKTLHSSE
jgi:hypothetical protein